MNTIRDAIERLGLVGAPVEAYLAAGLLTIHAVWRTIGSIHWFDDAAAGLAFAIFTLAALVLQLVIAAGLLRGSRRAFRWAMILALLVAATGLIPPSEPVTLQALLVHLGGVAVAALLFRVRSAFGRWRDRPSLVAEWRAAEGRSV